MYQQPQQPSLVPSNTYSHRPFSTPTWQTTNSSYNNSRLKFRQDFKKQSSLIQEVGVKGNIRKGNANEGEVIRLEILTTMKESLLNYIYFSALLPHWLWLDERKETRVSWEPTTCAGSFTHTNSCDHHNYPETYQCDNRKRLSNLPEVTAKWLHCVDELNINPGLFFCKARCSFQSSKPSTITLPSSSEDWAKDLKINIYDQQL